MTKRHAREWLRTAIGWISSVGLYGGEVVSPHPTARGIGIREFNDHVAADERTELVVLSIADGLTFARKR